MSGPIRTYILKAGDQLGDYKVVRPLGAGGMGEVYLVEHALLRKQYALKILPEDVSQDSTFIDRFRIEARVMADLEHPGIVRVHNFGSENGCYYLVMDFVSGADGAPRTLDDELAWGHKLPEHVTRSLAIQMCDALEFAHTFPAGSIIHRDLKPGNILIHHPRSNTSPLPDPEPDGPEPELLMKIADFGLARIVGTDYVKDMIDRSTRLTVMPMQVGDAEATEVVAGNSTISMLGTYDYMSPEQKTGESVDTRSDLYSLGLILYRMLLGHKPEGTYEPPSKSGASKRWDPIIAKCLERDINARYQSAGDLKKDLLAMTGANPKRTALMVGVPVAAALVSALLVVAFGALSGGGEDEKSKKKDGPAEVLPSGAIAFMVEAPAKGGVLSIMKGDVRIRDKEALSGAETMIPMMPGVYTFTLDQPEYRQFEQQVAIGENLPVRWAPSLIEAFGTLEFQVIEGQGLALLNESGKNVDLSTPERKERTEIYILKPGKYDAMITRAGYEPISRSINITDDQSTRLSVKLAPLPGSALIKNARSAEVWERNEKIGETDSWIKGLSAGSHRLELRREGYRKATVNVVVPPDGEVELHADALIEKVAILTVEVDVRKKDVPEEFVPSEGVLTIGEKTLGMVDLPWTGEVKELEKLINVTLDIVGFSQDKVTTVNLEDAEEETVEVRIKTQPVSLTIYSSVEAGVYRVRDKKMFFTGKDVPLGKTGDAFMVDAFTPIILSVLAEGYLPESLEVNFTTPGGKEVEVVTLEPDPDYVPEEPAAP